MADEDTTTTATVDALTENAATAAVDTGTVSAQDEAKAKRIRDAFGRFKGSDSQSTEQPAASSEPSTKAEQIIPAESKEASEKTEAETKPAEETTDTPVWTKRQIEVAKQLGLDTEEIASLKPGELLDVVGRKYNRKMSELGREQQNLRDGVRTKAEPSGVEKVDSGELKLDFEYAPEDFDSLGDDGIVSKNNRLIAYTKSLSERVAALEADINDRKENELADKADRFFTGLDKTEFPDFGTTKASELDEDSDELANRVRVVEEAQILQEAYAHRGKTLNFEDALDKAASMLFSENIKAAEQRKMAKKVEERRRQAGTRPTARTAAPTSENLQKQKLDVIDARLHRGV